MLMLITYDISLEDLQGQARLRRVAKICLDYGVRVQYSVFECDVAPDQWVKLKNQLLDTYNPDTDSLRFYHLGSKWRGKVEHHGAKPAVDVFQDVLIV
ncbi:MAG: CRISPR-associated endonuclease Cas2 [Neisseria sp.]|uniref:CRISPR-associated endonuclease Cas2 n=1 Tax=Neisseria sp. TaxID=192066 RepID=UPI0026DC1D74|nr:CRISPR-associated endonuclease Cas2 [Neisseria sp.]MDO4640091.1 CRISPR-associated endonuclease Cas2 [Neisseria sp.]